MDSTQNIQEDVIYRVVVNDEQQYSLLQVDRRLPNGWLDAGFVGSRQECLPYVRAHWTDMRPPIVRKQMSECVENTEARRAESMAG
jgi:MbtH protein